MAVMLLEWVFTSVFLILVVLVLRAALGKRMSAGARYALWAVVLVRLLVPVQLFTSPIAGTWVTTEKRTEQNVSNLLDVPTLPANNAEGDALKALGGQDGPSVTWNSVPQTPNPPRVPDAPEPPDFDNLPGWVEYLGWAWLAGAVIVAVVLLLSNLRFYWALRRERIPLDEADLPLRVYVAVGLPSPCLFGVFGPAIYVTPEAAANPDMLRHVLAHEYTHYKHGDHIWSLLRCGALAVHWWNPLVWLAARLSQRDGELACDEGALKRLGDGERAAYGSTLLALVTAKPRPGDLFRCATTMAGDKKSLKERITRIAAAPKRVLWAVVVAVLVTALACMCAFGQAEPEQDPAPAPSRDPEVSAQPSEEPAADDEVVWTMGYFVPDVSDVPEDVVYFIRRVVGEKYNAYETLVNTDENIKDLGIAFDDFRIRALQGPWTGMAYGMDLEVWRIDYEFHTTTPKEAENLLVGGNDLTEDGWLRPTYPGSTYVIFAVNDTGKRGFLTSVMYNMGGPSENEAESAGFFQHFYPYVAQVLINKGLADPTGLTDVDLDRDGMPETLRVVEFDGGMGRRLEVVKNGQVVWSNEGFHAHAGWVGLFLCTLDGEEYLLRYTPTMYGGICNYTYTLFTLDQNGREKVAQENSIEFDTNFGTPVFTGNFDSKSIAAFMGEINGLLANSIQLMNTDPDLAETFQREGRLYDSLGWLDWDWPGKFTRDPSKSLEENLLAFQEAMEDDAAQEASPYLAVLQGRGGLYSSEHGAWMTLDELCAKVGPGYDKDRIRDFSVLDLDGDGAQEVVLNVDPGEYRQWCVVLHEQDGEVRAYALYIRWLNTYTLKEDGAFCWSSSAFENGWGKLRFTADGYETADTIWHTTGKDDSSTIVYYIGGKTVSQAEYDAAYEAQEAVPDAAWYDFTEENINAAFS